MKLYVSIMRALFALLLLVCAFSAQANGRCQGIVPNDRGCLPDPPLVFIPVLMYHQFTEPASRENIPVVRFREQMKWLKDNGYTAVTMSDVARYVSVRGAIPDKTVAITIDDGFKTTLAAAEILREYGHAATFYLLSSTFAHDIYLSQDDVQRLAAIEKFEIGAHSHTHFMRWAANMDSLETSTMVYEMAQSRSILERVTQRPVRSFAWPFGYVRPGAQELAATLGFTSTATVDGVTHNTKGTSPFSIQRINIDGRCSIEQFKYMVMTGRLERCDEKTAGLVEGTVR